MMSDVAVIGGILGFILQLIILIVFFVTASNIGKLYRATRVQILYLHLLAKHQNQALSTPADARIEKMLTLSAKGETWAGW